ncbi:MAG: hypothetical protein MI810_04730 [Flavobacteriales bacterium]|nr:hypothetical protein [Flavobacteriales bacterium]
MDQNDELHISYEETLKRKHDFRIRYILSSEFTNRGVATVCQGIRPMFCYQKVPCDNQYHIWPEFETPSGEIIKKSNVAIRTRGTARMWIIDEDEKIEHLKRLKAGTKCYLFLGKQLLAECKVEIC